MVDEIFAPKKYNAATQAMTNAYTSSANPGTIAATNNAAAVTAPATSP